ncbi:hypothetical protein EV183_001201 [Coemansia sp. RSA 2336]|nr:hypothetical protein EV183_001201 [Coemansia sp. RSA 2336]
MAAETFGGSEKVQSAELDSEMLLSLRFGPEVNERSQRRIIHFVRRVLYPEENADNSYEMRRKRRRRDGRYASDYYSESDPEDTFDRKRKARRVESSNDRSYANIKSRDSSPERVNTIQTITFYSDAAGFDLDSTQCDTQDTIRFEHGTKAIVGLTNDQAQELGNPCFNCSMPGHEVRDCPMPQDQDRIQANRDAFKERGSGQFSSRLYLEIENEKRIQAMRETFQPGKPLSQELREALGLQHDDDVPEYIDRMYIHGYPPAYIGTDPDEDPLHARKLPTASIPSTPTLYIYGDAKDYDTVHGHNGGTVDSNSTQQTGDDSHDSKSDEEGAISDEEGAIDDTTASNKHEDTHGSRLMCKIPLVIYPGLDLRKFNFDSDDRPGRPLHAHTPLAYREFMSSYYAANSRDYSCSPGYRGDYYSGSRQRTRREYDYYNQPPIYHPSAGRNGESWDGMLENYYRSATNNYAAADEYGEYKVYRNHAPEPPETQQPQPKQSSTESQSNATLLTGTNSSKDDENGELEDGECDMELSE